LLPNPLHHFVILLLLAGSEGHTEEGQDAVQRFTSDNASGMDMRSPDQRLFLLQKEIQQLERLRRVFLLTGMIENPGGFALVELQKRCAASKPVFLWSPSYYLRAWCLFLHAIITAVYALHAKKDTADARAPNFGWTNGTTTVNECRCRCC
jgi:hypothetical protein